MADVFTTGADGFLEITKHPAADLVYTLNLAPYIGAEDLTAATWSVVTPGVMIEAQAVDTVGVTTTVRLSGGAQDRRYHLRVTWTFGADARVDAREVFVQVKLR